MVLICLFIGDVNFDQLDMLTDSDYFVMLVKSQ